MDLHTVDLVKIRERTGGAEPLRLPAWHPTRDGVVRETHVASYCAVTLLAPLTLLVHTDRPVPARACRLPSRDSGGRTVRRP
ncbi:hypothetical protein ACWCPT_28525 [Streptomyces sp. NPDC002308]